MDIQNFTTKDIGNLGERVAAEYLRRNGFELVDRNVSKKTGEIDIILCKDDTLHFVEVKTVLCIEFPNLDTESHEWHVSGGKDYYDPGNNLHASKIKKVVRTSEWYVADTGWEGEWQVDAALVWIRKRDGWGKVLYLPQIL
jgi:Holliday junction resolvase-like predicted endonuclease